MTDCRIAFLVVFILGMPLALPAAWAAGSDQELVAHLVFDPPHVAHGKVKNLAGSGDATIEGPIKFRPDVPIGAMLIDRDQNRITISHDSASDLFPKKEMTAEAWIAIDKTIEWGGIVAAVQDDGGRETGWMLGFRQSSFSFGLSSKGAAGGSERPTHIRSPHSLEWGRWYHVVGTYDGSVQKLYVNARLENSADVQSGDINYPEKPTCLMGAFVDEDATPRQRAWIHEVRVYARALSEEEIIGHYRAKRSSFPRLYRVKIGPQLERLDRDTIRITWDTEGATPSILAFGKEPPLTEHVTDDADTTHHAVTIDRIDPEGMYYYRIRTAVPPAAGRSSRLYEFDATFDYSPIRVSPANSPYPDDDLTEAYAQAARQIVRDTAITKGYCLVVGSGKGRLAYELAKQTQLQIICVDEDEADVAAAREALDKAGLYGVRVTVHRGSLSKLAYQDYFANLVVSDQLLASGELPGDAAEILRVVRPGGVAYLGRPAGLKQTHTRVPRRKLKNWIRAGSIRDYQINDGNGLWAVIRRGPLPGAGAWTHQYGDAGNSSNSQDKLLGDRMEVLWFGRPGPRPMVDRGTRAPAPLSINGRLFVQGDRRLFGLDAYNGTILWELEIPDLRRANVPRDCSNMAAADDSVYVAVRDRCWRLDANTGKRLSTFPVPTPSDAYSYDWGYVACVGDTLLGSAVRRGALFIAADGEWYDRSDEESHKVTSDYLFALDRRTGRTLWTYQGDGVAVNATVAVGGGRVYLVEGRSPEAVDSEARRLSDELSIDQYLVGLDLKTGEKLWERCYRFGSGRFVLYLSYANDTLIALSTSDKYHLYAFNAPDASPLWQTEYAWARDNHGGAMQHPAIVGDVVYAEPRAFKLRTGEVVRENLPRRVGCGGISASANCLFYRDGYHSMWNLESDRRSTFTGVRSGCWLGMIPAGGILLAPESSAGCYCSQPVQTSIAFLPRGDAKPTQKE